ncbi:MAG: DNA mismatch repair protein MutS, partial [Bacteroidota bacterium]
MATKTTKTKKKGATKVTPLMQQYFSVKAKYPDAILLFRVGDFYETFGEDAVTASQVLGIVLTNRNNGGSKIELAGFPHHSMNVYLPRLVKAGYRVAVCEQLEKPSKEKKIVRRGVTEVVTPGVAIDEQLLDHKKNNFLAALVAGKKERYGLALLDISTGEFLVSEGDRAYTDKLLQSFLPSELLLPKGRRSEIETWLGTQFYTTTVEDWVFTPDYTQEKLRGHFAVSSMKGFGVDNLEVAQIAAGSILHYLETTENTQIQHVNRITRVEPDRYVWLDRFTIRNLELIYPMHPQGVSLIDILDKTISPMGGRLLKKWVALPLKDLNVIRKRHDLVEVFMAEGELRGTCEGYIGEMGDLERLISKVPLNKINPREIVQVRHALGAIGPMREQLMACQNAELVDIAEGLDPCADLQAMIQQRILSEPPINLAKGGVIADGFDEDLDELRFLVKRSNEVLEGICNREREATGIDNLKIGFNNVFGYYLEVTNKHKDKGLVPESWMRKQTLTNAERYITDELKELEAKILGAEEKILAREAVLYQQLVGDMLAYVPAIQKNAHLIARIDCLLSFAKVATRYRYCKPSMNESLVIDIKAGRHPVIEQQLELGTEYVPNDVYLSNEEQQILMITGPNMAGKSALLRQTALISLMAQMGSFVPAESAELGWVDKVFTRVGASDNISSGESTFMVEMNETASILNNISERSLILLDEIGRGTSTYDGISIAWSIAEFLHSNPLASPKTLFATHYHELNELANRFGRIKNFSIATREVGKQVIFLRKLIPGGSQHSFGIHVARLAGMPRAILERAEHILEQLEQKSIAGGQSSGPDEIPVKEVSGEDVRPADLQLSIFETVDPVLGKIKETLQDMQLDG